MIRQLWILATLCVELFADHVVRKDSSKSKIPLTRRKSVVRKTRVDYPLEVFWDGSVGVTEVPEDIDDLKGDVLADMRGDRLLCNQSNKQKALYANFVYSPSANMEQLFDVSSTITWTSIKQLDDYGAKGIYEANTIGTVNLSGYFGAQIKSKGSDMFLFSIWDNKKKGLYALPVHPNCKRNCNDCSADETTGTKCFLNYDMSEGESFTMRINQISKNGTAQWQNKTFSGAVWRVTAVPTGNQKEEVVVGEILFQDTTSGLNRFNFFHEHIGCTFCDSFYTSVHRTFPVVAFPKNTKASDATGKHGCKTSADCSCKLYSITGSDNVVNFQTGPGVEANVKMGDAIPLI